MPELPRRLRVEVDRFDQGRHRATVLYVDADHPPPDLAARLAPVVEDAVARLGRPDARLLLAERIADAEAYEREAARRGVLAL
jgi:hypothetical protein